MHYFWSSRWREEMGKTFLQSCEKKFVLSDFSAKGGKKNSTGGRGSLEKWGRFRVTPACSSFQFPFSSLFSESRLTSKKHHHTES